MFGLVNGEMWGAGCSGRDRGAGASLPCRATALPRLQAPAAGDVLNQPAEGHSVFSLHRPPAETPPRPLPPVVLAQGQRRRAEATASWAPPEMERDSSASRALGRD